MGIVKKTMNLGEVDSLFRQTTACLEQKSPVKSPLIKTLKGLQPILQQEATEFVKELEKMVDSYEENGKPNLKEGVSEEDYMTAINANKAKEVQVEIHTIKETENYILPTGERIRIKDYLEKSVDVTPAVFNLLTEVYLQN